MDKVEAVVHISWTTLRLSLKTQKKMLAMETFLIGIAGPFPQVY